MTPALHIVLIGMPGATDDIGNWLEPLGLLSLLVEGFVVWQSLAALAGLSRKQPQSGVDKEIHEMQTTSH